MIKIFARASRGLVHLVTQQACALTPGEHSNSPQPRCAAYYRSSGSVESLDNQRRSCRDAALARGWMLPPELEFTDQRPATSTDRPGLEALLQAVAADRPKAVFVSSIDRLARSPEAVAELVRKLTDELGVAVVVLA